jgi:hypothetical protein
MEATLKVIYDKDVTAQKINYISQNIDGFYFHKDLDKSIKALT